MRLLQDSKCLKTGHDLGINGALCRPESRMRMRLSAVQTLNAMHITQIKYDCQKLHLSVGFSLIMRQAQKDKKRRDGPMVRR